MQKAGCTKGAASFFIKKHKPYTSLSEMSKISYAKNDAEFLRCNELKLSRNSGLFQMILVKLDLKKTSYLAHVIFVFSQRD